MGKRILLGSLLFLFACSGERGEETAVPPAPTPSPHLPISPSPTSPDPTNTPIPEPTNLQSPISAADANVLFVKAAETASGVWTFSVTVAHLDTGWEDYADGWDVMQPDGTVILPDPDSPFTRLLLHPHETEQPFTRSQSNIVIPEGVTAVTVRAHDLVDGFGGQEVVVELTAVSTDTFEVTRFSE